MYTSATSTPPSFQKPNPTDLDSAKNYSCKNCKNKEIEDEGNKEKNSDQAYDSNRIQNRLAEDIYKPAYRSNIKESATIDSIMAVQSRESSISQSAEIKIQTKEGDEITISLNQLASSSRNTFQMEQGEKSLSSYTEIDSFESDFSLTIEGDLNKGELKSLKHLLKKMHKVTNDFFNGDVKSAFRHAQKVGFDTTYIAGFSMDLNREQSVNAVAAYQQTARPEQNINTDMLKQAREFLANTKDFISDSKSILDSLAEPKQSFSDLFNLVGQLNSGAHEKTVENADHQLFRDIINNISDGVFSNKV